MIPYDRILLEMERQLGNARQSADEAGVREALAAIKSLCDLMLADAKKPAAVQQAAPLMPAAIPDMPLTGKPLEEEDANGGSLFDF